MNSISKVCQMWYVSLHITNRAFTNRFFIIIFLPVVVILGSTLIVSTPILNKLCRVRLVLFNLPSLGHDMFEFLTYIEEYSNWVTPKKTVMLYYNRKKESINNAYLFEIWRRITETLEGIKIQRISALTWSILAFVSMYREIDRYWLTPLHPNYSRYTSIPKKRSLALFTKQEKKLLLNFLAKVFGDQNIEYCVLGMRDQGYYGVESNRNGRIEEYLMSIEHLLDLGIPVIRMGRRALKPLPLHHPLLFDYSFSEYVDDRMDVLLWAHAKFAFGDASGLTDAVALFGAPIFVPTYPLDPRSFLSNSNVFFATQKLLKIDSSSIKINELLKIMNTGVNIGDEKVLTSLQIQSKRPSPEEICSSLKWFLKVAVHLDQMEILRSQRYRELLIRYLQKNDHNSFLHYRQDALYSDSWTSMKSLIYPESIISLMEGNGLENQ